ncbi:MAG TPA: HdeD family acid-resistance protein [Solirubrobacterales bacterium]|nr:HdeD family acid-resistance protein [Solirubrobacterales bacterium]
MEYGGASMDPVVRDGLTRSWKGLMAVGIVAIVIGCIAILIPAVASVGTAIFIGWILVIAGAFLVAAAFSAHSVGSLLLRLLWAAITVIVGLWLIVEPHNGTLTLTFVLGVYFLFMGITRITVAFLGRGQPNAGWVGLSGVCGLLIGILVLVKFPSSADWAIGLLVGIDLIFAGWTLTAIALVGKELSRGSSQARSV